MVTGKLLASPLSNKQTVYFLTNKQCIFLQNSVFPYNNTLLFLKSMTSLNSYGKREMREMLHMRQNLDLMNLENLSRRRNWAWLFLSVLLQSSLYLARLYPWINHFISVLQKFFMNTMGKREITVINSAPRQNIKRHLHDWNSLMLM